MSDNHGIQRIVEEIEYLRAKRVQHGSPILRLLITHGHHRAVKDCIPGETIEQVSIAVRSHVIQLCLSPTGLVLADVFGRKRPMALTAAHIERIIASDPFYVRLGANAAALQKATIRLTRKTIKVYVRRLRQQIGRALKEAGLATRPEEVLVSESTDLMNVTAYRFSIPCEFVHLGATAGRS